MDTRSNRKPMNISELFPNLTAILSEDAKLILTAKKKPRSTTVQNALTSEKDYKPRNLNEMWDDLKSLRVPSSREQVQNPASTKTRWNSSVKVDKRKSIKLEGNLQKTTVRKVLNFQTKPKVQNPKPKIPAETPKFPKPEFRAKKSILKQQVSAHNTVRISGICNIPETPDIINNPIRSRMTLAEKENRQFAKPNPIGTRSIIKPLPVPKTPQANESWKSSCDDSFLQKEKEIDDIERREVLQESKVNRTPHVSTPYTRHRNIEEYFENSNLDDSAAYKDNTIMCFDKTSNSKDNNKREESVIVSLCDLLKNATVNDIDRPTTTDNLLNLEKETEQNLIAIEKTIKMLYELKESKTKTLKLIRKMMKEGNVAVVGNCEKTLVEAKNDSKTVKIETISENISPPVKSKACSVIKSCLKTPTYKIPRKSPCLKKMVLYKSMPNQLDELRSPKMDMGKRALSMYMELKQHMNFLNTPLKKPQDSTEPNTPAITSHNLQMQLERLYDEC